MNKEKYKAKFAEKLMSNQVMIPQVFTAGYDVIDEICSDYQSRTCDNCQHFIDEKGTSMQFCNAITDGGIIGWNGYGKDFGCNKFERIQDGL